MVKTWLMRTLGGSSALLLLAAAPSLSDEAITAYQRIEIYHDPTAPFVVSYGDDGSIAVTGSEICAVFVNSLPGSPTISLDGGSTFRVLSYDVSTQSNPNEPVPGCRSSYSEGLAVTRDANGHYFCGGSGGGCWFIDCGPIPDPINVVRSPEPQRITQDCCRKPQWPTTDNCRMPNRSNGCPPWDPEAP